MSKSKAAKAIAAALVTAGLTVIPAWSALAVTNPADNPSPITVQGDDGNTYNDGADTLPGYDDEECTYIPGAYFDFAANRVRYADGQSIHWTEWDRASGYREWLARQNSTATTNTNNETSNTSNTSNNTSTSTGTTKTATPATALKKTATKTSEASDKTLATTPVTEEVVATSTASAAEENVTVTFGGQTANNPGRTVGLTILVSLLGASLLLLAGNALRTRFQQGGTN